MCRPEFISQSRQRVQRLALQVEERKLQEVFIRERDELFTRPGGPGRLPKPAGTPRSCILKPATVKRNNDFRNNPLWTAFIGSIFKNLIYFFFCLCVKAPLCWGGLFPGRRWYRDPNSKIFLFNIIFYSKCKLIGKLHYSLNTLQYVSNNAN